MSSPSLTQVSSSGKQFSQLNGERNRTVSCRLIRRSEQENLLFGRVEEYKEVLPLFPEDVIKLGGV